jgi:hypothetical protein
VNDHYDTPVYTTRSLLKVHDIRYPVLEPCAGNSMIANMLNDGDVVTNDINEMCRGDYVYDYLTNDSLKEIGFRTIITNPPFNIAQENIEKSLEDVIVGGEVIMLLRLNFLGSQKRKTFWDSAPIKHIYVLSKRPSFTKDGKTDSIEYMWAVFERGYTGKATMEVI